MAEITRCSMGDRVRRWFALAGKITNSLAARIGDQLEAVVQEKRRYWGDVRNEPVRIDEIPNLIDSYAKKNALVAAGASLVPGPLGLVSALPEIALITRNQIAMICDLAASYGHQKVISRELVLGILLSSTSTGGLGILTMFGEKWVIKRISLRMFQRAIRLLGGRITEQLLRKYLLRWVPGAGAVIMASWARTSTRRLGQYAQSVLSKKLAVAEETVEAPVPVVEL